MQAWGRASSPIEEFSSGCNGLSLEATANRLGRALSIQASIIELMDSGTGGRAPAFLFSVEPGPIAAEVTLDLD